MKSSLKCSHYNGSVLIEKKPSSLINIHRLACNYALNEK